jgi:hypothetical protein
VRGGAGDRVAGGRVAVRPLADQLGGVRADQSGRVAGEQADRGREHRYGGGAAGAGLAPVASEGVHGRDPHPLARVRQRADQERDAVAVHQVIQDLAALLAHPLIRVRQSVPGRLRRLGAERDQPLIGAEGPVLVAKQRDEIRRGHLRQVEPERHGASVRGAADQGQRHFCAGGRDELSIPSASYLDGPVLEGRNDDGQRQRHRRAARAS